jgi:hypothetical protein
MTHGERVPAREVTESLTNWLAYLRLGDSIDLGSLALVPVYSAAKPARIGFQTLADALISGAAFVTEAPRPTVPSVRVENRGTLPVFILDGEEIVGGHQNRIAKMSVLVPPKSVVNLPVLCVEQGRWQPNASTFASGDAAFPTLRRAKLVPERGQNAGQYAVWDEIRGRHARDGAVSPTGAMQDLSARRVDHETESARFPTDGPTGVIALVSGRSFCADLFGSPELLSAYWPRLVRSYMLDAENVPSRRPSLGSARRLIQRVTLCDRRFEISVGMGQAICLSGRGTVGTGLACGNEVVHLAVFRQRASEPPIHRKYVGR